MDIRRTPFSIYHHKYGRWFLHLAFWGLFFIARYYIGMISLNPLKAYPRGILMGSLFATISTAAAFCSLVYLIYERIYKKKFYATAIILFLLWLVSYAWLDYYFELLLLKDNTWRQLMMRHNPDYFEYLNRHTGNILLSRVATLGIVYQLFIYLAFPLMIKIALAFSNYQVRMAELSKQNLQLEFSFLKSQVNPHFLFNSLNNIYSLIIHDKKEMAADLVARLTGFMRYSLHETEGSYITSLKEISLMKDYIELERIRLNHTQVTSSFITDEKERQMPPLLFMPMIENAFKFCPDESGSFIEVTLSITNGLLTFTCSNRFDAEQVADRNGGIGLLNSRKRLQQHYPGKHTYETNHRENVYSVHVTIELE